MTKKNLKICHNMPSIDLLLLLLVVFALVAVDLLWQDVVFAKRILQIGLVVLAGGIVLLRCLWAAKQADSRASAIEQVFDRLTDGILLVCNTNQILLINQAAKNYLSLLPGYASAEQAEPPLPVDVRKFVRECSASAESLSIEIDTRQAEQQVLRLVGRQVGDEELGKNCVLVVLTDLTETKKSEKRQRDGISNVSHELKTPIAAIKISSEALMEGALNDPSVSHKFLTNIVTECDRLEMFVDNLIRVARFDSGSLTFRRQPQTLESVIEHAMQMLSVQVANKSIDVELHIPEGLSFSLDRDYMSIVVKNLLENAIAYSENGSKVKIVAQVDNGELIMSVEDRGAGMPQGELGSIFDRFYRIDRARTYQAGGSGLGLAIVKKVVELHDGSIEVESALDKGSKFTVRIPPETMQQSAEL